MRGLKRGQAGMGKVGTSLCERVAWKYETHFPDILFPITFNLTSVSGVKLIL